MKYEIHVDTAYIEEYQRLKEKQERMYAAQGLQSYYESVRGNKDMFDREYYKTQLKAKGFVFPEDYKKEMLDMEFKTRIRVAKRIAIMEMRCNSNAHDEIRVMYAPSECHNDVNKNSEKYMRRVFDKLGITYSQFVAEVTNHASKEESYSNILEHDVIPFSYEVINFIDMCFQEEYYAAQEDYQEPSYEEFDGCCSQCGGALVPGSISYGEGFHIDGCDDGVVRSPYGTYSFEEDEFYRNERMF